MLQNAANACDSSDRDEQMTRDALDMNSERTEGAGQVVWMQLESRRVVDYLQEKSRLGGA